MKAIELLQMAKKYNVHITNKMIDEAIEEIETLQQELKQGQDNYDKLWDMYSELKKEKEK